MDMGDFVAEEYTLRFTIQGRQYEVRYPEASVDEVLAIMSKQQQPTSQEDEIAGRRRTVTEFFKKHLTTGDPEQLEKDLALVPYMRAGVAFDIQRLYEPLMMRVKK